MTKGWLIQAGELRTFSGPIRNQTNPYRLASLWNTRSTWSCTFKRGKGWHTQPHQQFPCHSSAPGHWPELAGTLVGRAGLALATAAPSLWHLQSPLPTQRGHGCTGPCSAWAHAPPDPSYFPGSCTPRDPSTLKEPLHGAPHSQDLLPMVGNTFPTASQGLSEHGSTLSTVHQPDGLGLCSCHQTLSSLHYSQFLYIYIFKQPAVKLVKTLAPEWFQIF